MGAFFIAEIGVNHCGSEDIGKTMIKAASRGGANAAKFQAYTADKIAAKYSPAYWDLSEEPTESQYDLFRKHQMNKVDFYESMAQCCKSNNIEFMCTFFDVEIFHELKHLVKTHKISSSDLTNYQLLSVVASDNKPIILSTGAADIDEVQKAVDFLLAINSGLRISILHCVLNYPCKPENSALNRLEQLKSVKGIYNYGYSCHVAVPEGIDICIAARCKGVEIIEKHFTLCNGFSGNDHYHAFTFENLIEFRKRELLIDEASNYKQEVFLSNQQKAIDNALRSIYAKRDIKKGSFLIEEDLIPLRPRSSKGIPANLFFDIIGKQVKCSINKGQLLELSSIYYDD